MWLECVNPGKMAHSGYLDQRLSHARVAKRIPLLHHVSPQHRGQRVGRASAIRAGPDGNEARSGRVALAPAPPPPSQPGTSRIWCV